ncbi:mRNA 3'-end-processing protein rna14, partial [Dimargaris xerosporica]
MPSCQQLDQLVQRNRYNAQAWLDLLKQTVATGVDQDVRNVYQRFTDVFPTAGAHWAKWATYEFNKGHYDDVVSLFTKSLDTVYSVDLYRFYLDYVTKMHTTEAGLTASPESYNTIAQAYEFALGRVGLDRRAGAIWAKFLAFLASQEPQSQWEEQRKLDQLRATYQRAIMVPTDQLLQIWKDYDTFENTTNRHT